MACTIDKGTDIPRAAWVQLHMDPGRGWGVREVPVLPAFQDQMSTVLSRGIPRCDKHASDAAAAPSFSGTYHAFVFKATVAGSTPASRVAQMEVSVPSS